jgi:predicted SnoaL-like aldol condensation-catalyzing enzyme
VAEGDYVVTHGRFSGNGRPAAWIATDMVRIEDGKLAEHWDVLQAKRRKPNPGAGCRCSATAFPPDRSILQSNKGSDP